MPKKSYKGKKRARSYSYPKKPLKKLKSDVKKLKKTIEWKMKEHTFSGNINAATGATNAIQGLTYGIDRGTGKSDRIGNSIKIHRIKFLLRTQYNDDDTNGFHQTFRLILARFKEDVADNELSRILSQTSTPALMSISPFTSETIQGYRILLDKRININWAVTKEFSYIKKTIRFPRKPLVATWIPGTPDTPTKNHVLMWLWKERAETVTSGYDCSVKIYYTE